MRTTTLLTASALLVACSGATPKDIGRGLGSGSRDAAEDGEQLQSYAPPANVVLARRIDLGFGGPGGYYTDSAYDMGADPQFADLPHQGSTATLTFTLEGDGVQSLDDESWAIDNVRITLGDTPRSTSAGGS